MKKGIKILFVLLSMVMFYSCNNKNIEEKISEMPAVGETALSFNFGKMSNEQNISNLTVKLTHSGGTRVEKQLEVDPVTKITTGLITDLIPGSWIISVAIFDGVKQVGTGNGAVTIKVGETAKAYVGIRFETGDTTNTEYEDVIKIEKTGTFDFELNNLSGENVYFIFTNKNDGSILSPQITKSINSQGSLSRNSSETSNSVILPKFHEKGSDKITKLNEELGKKIKTLKKSTNKINKNIVGPQKTIIVGDKEVFYGSENEIVNATLRKVQSAHGKNVHMWVADNSWYDGGTKATKVNQNMVDILSDKFLKEGTNNDIYEWVSNIVGEPWGEQPYSQLIAPTEDIHILLYDIDNDNSVTGGVCGYFWAKDNFNKSYYSNSNEKLMFVIDSVMFAKEEGSSWEVGDYWPQFMVSTLAHEFQHMINFYQKSILRESDSDSWVNELASMSVEDLVARKILADGPRGVNYNTATAGSLDNYYGRIPLYNQNNNKQLTEWTQDLPSYSMSYTFGAYLMRNYGGAEFIKNLVQNSKDSKESVVEALKLGGYNLSFEEVLRNFAVANLLSDSLNQEQGYRFNNDTWATSSINGMNYDLGAINLYNYAYKPKIVDSLPTNLNGVSNTYYNGGVSLMGNNKWTINNLSSDVKMTVVIRK